MKEKMKSLTDKAKKAANTAAMLVGDLNGDGKVDAEDARIAAKWAKSSANTLSSEAAKVGKGVAESDFVKGVIHSDIVKDAATAAVVGAGLGVAVPIIGPVAGAVFGATVGVYKNLGKASNQTARDRALPQDIHTELLKLDDLKQRELLTDAEFEIQKQKILNNGS